MSLQCSNIQNLNESATEKWLQPLIAMLAFLFLIPCQPLNAQISKPQKKSRTNQDIDLPIARINVATELKRLLHEEDTDGDKKITIEDSKEIIVLGHIAKSTKRGDQHFNLFDVDGKQYEIIGTYPLSNLLQELTLAKDSGVSTANISFQKIFEEPVDRISRTIRERLWDGLTRRIDGDYLESILKDEKVSGDGYRYVYVPSEDKEAWDYFSNLPLNKLNVRVVRLPANPTSKYVRDLDGRHGILCLGLMKNKNKKLEGVPFVVPGGRFNEMYGWDSYFEALGLLVDGRIDLAKAMVDNFVYQITHYGQILNANRTYYLTRSQPPFLTSMALAVYKELPKNPNSKEWLRTVLEAAMKEYNQVWMGEGKLTGIGLSRYYGTGYGPPPEVEEGHFDPIFKMAAAKKNRDWREYEEDYRNGKIKDKALDRFFMHDRAGRESGHDTTYRWDDRCADFVTVDLNTLLYKYEIDIARTIEKEFGGKLLCADGTVETAKSWQAKANKRKRMIQKYFWNDESGMFFDYDIAVEEQSTYVSATTFYPLWACYPDDPSTFLCTSKQAERLIQNALPLLEVPGGIVGSTKESRGKLTENRPERQWDFPNGWAPHQIMIWRGLRNYGYNKDANRLTYRWLYTITRNAVDYNGTITEKVNVVTRSHQVFAEYGNVGTKFQYITKEGFGWMNASFQVGLDEIPASYRQFLNRLVPPEWLFSTRSKLKNN